MYGQSALGGLNRFTVTLVIIGFLLCLGLVDSDLVNPFQSLAQFRQAQVEIEREKAQNAIDAEVAEALKEERLQAEREKMEAEKQHQLLLQQLERERQRLQNQLLEENIQTQREHHQAELEHEQKLQAAELAARQQRLELQNQVFAIASTAAIIVASILIVAAGVTACIVRAKHRINQRQVEAEILRRKALIQAARQREREARRRMLAHQRKVILGDQHHGGNGRQRESHVLSNTPENVPLSPDKYNNLPLVG